MIKVLKLNRNFLAVSINLPSGEIQRVVQYFNVLIGLCGKSMQGIFFDIRFDAAVSFNYLNRFCWSR